MNTEELKRYALAAKHRPDLQCEHVMYRAAANPAAILELIRQREELLAALKDSLRITAYVSCQSGVVDRCECADCIDRRIHAAIAKAEG